jgi:hypothetical protein
MSDINHSSDIKQVLFFAGQLSGQSRANDARRVAQDKGWLDPSGRLTRAGAELLEAFRDQSHTRTVFRPLC